MSFYVISKAENSHASQSIQRELESYQLLQLDDMPNFLLISQNNYAS